MHGDPQAATGARAGRRSPWILAPAAVIAVIALGVIAASSVSGHRREESVTATGRKGNDPEASAPADGRLLSGQGFDVVQVSERAWSGVRSTTDGTALVIAFVGGPPFDESDACSVEYRGVVDETRDRAEVTLYGRHPTDEPTACNALGYFRTVTVALREPIGDRTLALEPGDVAPPVFDGSALAVPGWLPEGWSLQRESNRYLGAVPASTWMRVWGPSPTPGPSAVPCRGADATAISLTQGPPELLESLPATDAAHQSRQDIHGHHATYRVDEPNRTAYLYWLEGDQAYVVATRPACNTDTLTTEAALVRFAQALRVP